MLVVRACVYSEHLFMEMADHMVSDGFKDVGYEYVNIDVRILSLDCTHKHAGLLGCQRERQ